MNRIKDMWRISIIFLLLSGVWCQLRAQNVVFSAAPSANKIGVKDQVQVQYTVKDAQNLQSIAPGQSPDFTIVQGPFQSQSTNISMVGNRTVQSQSITLTYILQPKHEGTFTIPPATAKDAAGHTFQSNTMSIQVVSGSIAQQQQRRARRDPFGDDADDPFAALLQQQQRMQQLQQQLHNQMAQQPGPGQRQQQQPPAPGQRTQPAEDPPVNEEDIKKDLFIKVVVDNNDVHVGEQITTTYKLYSRLPMQINISKLPTLNGFWTQDFEIPRQPKPTEEIIDGKKYQVFVLKKSALFPQQTGTLELDPAEAKGMARVPQQVKRRMSDLMDPFGAGTLLMSDPFFNNSVFNTTMYKDVAVNLKSTPVKIKVSALPDKDQPKDFGGAVGNFTIASKIDKEELTTDDVATFTMNITGSGNIKIFEVPKLNLPNGLNTFDPQIQDTITGRSTTISGTKKITYTITPHTPGDYDLPAIPFTYFNPSSGTYVTLHTQAVKIHVKPGKHYTTPARNDNNLAINDIHDIIDKPLNKISFSSKPLLLTAGYWSMYALPLLAFIGMVSWKKRDEELSKDSVLLKKKRANKIALKRLVTAQQLLLANSKGPFYEEVSKAIWLYLSDKINIPLSSLSKETATEALTGRNVPLALQKNLESVIWECETALYASGGSNQMNKTYEDAIKVISDLEDVIKA